MPRNRRGYLKCAASTERLKTIFLLFSSPRPNKAIFNVLHNFASVVVTTIERAKLQTGFAMRHCVEHNWATDLL